MNVYVSSGRTPMRRASSSSSERARPRARTSSSEIAASAAISGVSSCGEGAIDRDDRAQVRQRVADRRDLRQLRGVLADDRARVGVGDDPVALFGRVGLVDRHDHRPRGCRGEIGVGPLGAGVGEDAHALARLDAEIDQPERDLAHDVGPAPHR